MYIDVPSSDRTAIKAICMYIDVSSSDRTAIPRCMYVYRRA